MSRVSNASEYPDSTSGVVDFVSLICDTSDSLPNSPRQTWSWFRGVSDVLPVHYVYRPYTELASSATQGSVQIGPVHSVKYLTSICRGGQRLVFEGGLSLEVETESDDGLSLAYNRAFGIYGSGDGPSEALQDFEQSFIEFFASIVESPDNVLSRSALDFKRRLQMFALLEISD